MENQEHNPTVVIHAEIVNRLANLRERGFYFSGGDIALRIQCNHSRIFVGYGAEHDPHTQVFAIREAFARKHADGYETPVHTTCIAVPQEQQRQFAADAAFRAILLRRCVAARDELDGFTIANGTFKQGLALFFDGIKNGTVHMAKDNPQPADLKTIAEHPALLQPKWKFRLGGRWNYLPIAAQTLEPGIVAIVAADPRNYHRHDEWRAWYGIQLQKARDGIISGALTAGTTPKIPEKAPATASETASPIQNPT